MLGTSFNPGRNLRDANTLAIIIETPWMNLSLERIIARVLSMKQKA